MPVARGWTTRDVRALMDESRPWPRYELIAGELLVTPAPATAHQIATGELMRMLADYVDAHGIGVACTSPADLELQPGTITQPDVFVIRAHSRGAHDDSASWEGITSLLLAVEVISPYTGRQDRVTKRDFYLGADVAEYWVVDLDARLVERWTPDRATPQLERGTFAWPPAGAPAPLMVDVAALFARVERKVRLIAARGRG
ncbi:MAG TPA: Uma2 family endonuclease [Gemmatimonadaceae bacterium]|nr:Uma2 family endonuclease [Gemmatimonadaceae bacterium]